MAKVVDEDGNVNIGRPVAPPPTEYSPALFQGDWKRRLVIIPKKSVTGEMISPFTTGYYRQRETFSKGQRLLLTEWMSSTEYVMMLLKREVAIYGSD